MKNEIALVCILSLLTCKAQSLIKSLDGDVSCPPYDSNCYEKDVNNEFNKFEGEWKYQSRNDEITIKLRKETHYQTSQDSNYMDLLVGEYSYIENGVEKVNTLADFNNPSLSGYQHNISGGVFVHQLPSYCIDNSNPNEIKVELFISDPNNHFIEGRIILRYVNANGAEKLEACIYDSTTMGTDDPDAKIDIPDGNYELFKQ